MDSFEQIIQLYETTLVRHGLMLVGPTGGGKTCNYRGLAGAMSLLNLEGSTKYERVCNSSFVGSLDNFTACNQLLLWHLCTMISLSPSVFLSLSLSS